MHYYGVDEDIVKIWVITFDSHVFCDYLNYLKLNPYTCIVFFSLGLFWIRGTCYVFVCLFWVLQVNSFSYIDKFFSEENPALVAIMCIVSQFLYMRSRGGRMLRVKCWATLM